MKIDSNDLATLRRSAGAILKSPRGAYKLMQQLPATDRTAKLLECLSRKLPLRPPCKGLNRLEAFFDANPVRGIQKWRHYFDIYERYFGKFVDREVHIVEVGVESGGSMDMWRHYFGDRCHVYGIDIDPRCKKFERDEVNLRRRSGQP
jgi:hypothetical protein